MKYSKNGFYEKGSQSESFRLRTVPYKVYTISFLLYQNDYSSFLFLH